MDVDAQVAASLRHLFFTDAARAPLAPRGGACTHTCTARHFPVRVFRVSAAQPPWTVDVTPPMQGPFKAPPMFVHPCVDELCSLPDLHRHDVTERYRTRFFCVSRGAYWCHAHARMHVCTLDCALTITDNHGASVCVLSGTRVANRSEREFDPSRGVLFTQEYVSFVEGAKQKRRRTAHDRQWFGVHVQGATRVARLAGRDSNSDVHVDEPCDAIFGDSLEENTFGDGVAATLNNFYAVAYAVIERLLTSNDRHESEFLRRLDARRAALTRMRRYLDASDCVFVHTLHELRDQEITHRNLSPQIILPRHGCRRLFAYLSLVCIEFYVQLRTAALSFTWTGVDRDRVENFQSLRFERIVWVIYYLMSDGLRLNDYTFIPREHLLLYPATNIQAQLGVTPREFTHTRTTLVGVLRQVWGRKTTLPALQTTQMLPEQYLFHKGSIVEFFLHVRRKRVAGLRTAVQATN